MISKDRMISVEIYLQGQKLTKVLILKSMRLVSRETLYFSFLLEIKNSLQGPGVVASTPTLCMLMTSGCC